MLQQRLPLAVLKPCFITASAVFAGEVATALTACGIETEALAFVINNRILVATALTACGIETLYIVDTTIAKSKNVATALTACGIETVP